MKRKPKHRWKKDDKELWLRWFKGKPTFIVGYPVTYLGKRYLFVDHTVGK